MNREFSKIEKEFINACNAEISKKRKNKAGTVEGLQNELKQLQSFVDKLTPILNNILEKERYEFEPETLNELTEFIKPTFHKMIKKYWDK